MAITSVGRIVTAQGIARTPTSRVLIVNSPVLNLANLVIMRTWSSAMLLILARTTSHAKPRPS